MRLEHGRTSEAGRSAPEDEPDAAAGLSHELAPSFLPLRWFARLCALMLRWGAWRLAGAAGMLCLALWVLWLGAALASTDTVAAMMPISGSGPAQVLWS